MIEDSVKYSGSIEYADQTDEVIREAIRIAMSGTPGPTYVEYPSHVILEELDVPPVLPPHRYRLTNQGADGDRIAEAAELILKAKNPILLVGHAVHTTKSGDSGQGTGAQDELPGDPDLGRHQLHQGDRGPHLPVCVLRRLDRSGRGNATVVVALGTELGEPVHFGRWRHWYAGEANRKWIYVQQDPTAIGVNRPIDVPLVGDVRAVVPQLTRALGRRPRRRRRPRKVHEATARPNSTNWRRKR